MSLLRRDAQIASLDVLTRARAARTTGNGTLTQAMQQSVVWASVNLRASLLSMMPADIFRKSGDANVEAAGSPFFTAPDHFAEGHPTSFSDWMYASQVSLDLYGNSVGIITSTSALGLPATIELVKPEELSMRIKGHRISEYRVNGELVPSRHIWHERKNMVPGVPVGMCTILYMAVTLGGIDAARHYAADWFAGDAIPNAVLRNENREVDPADAEAMKQRFLDRVHVGEPFVTGKDWTYTPVGAKASESAFIEMLGMGSVDLVRYMGVPADVVDVKSDASGSITYANITQKNLQLMTINLGPDVKRREDALSSLLVRPRFVKLNRSVVLAMDDQLRADVMKARIEARILAPSEARALDNLEPLTDAQKAEFWELFGNPNKTTPEKATA